MLQWISRLFASENLFKPKSTLNTSFSVGGSDHTGLRKDIFIPEPVSHRCTKQNLLRCCILSIIKSILHPFKHTLIKQIFVGVFFLLSLPSLCQQSLSLLHLTVWLLQTSVLMHVPILPPPHAFPTPPDQYENIRVLRQCGPSRRPGTAAANLQTVMKGQLLTELARRAGRFAPRTRPQRHVHWGVCDGTSELGLDGGLLVTVILDLYC